MTWTIRRLFKNKLSQTDRRTSATIRVKPQTINNSVFTFATITSNSVLIFFLTMRFLNAKRLTTSFVLHRSPVMSPLLLIPVYRWSHWGPESKLTCPWSINCMNQGSAKRFCKGPDSEYFRLWGPYGCCCNNWAQLCCQSINLDHA